MKSQNYLPPSGSSAGPLIDCSSFPAAAPKGGGQICYREGLSKRPIMKKASYIVIPIWF